MVLHLHLVKGSITLLKQPESKYCITGWIVCCVFIVLLFFLLKEYASNANFTEM